MAKTTKFNMGDKLCVITCASEMIDNGVKEGDIVTVTEVEDLGGGKFKRVGVNGLTNGGLGFDDDRFEFVKAEITSLPDVFEFSTCAGKYRMTKRYGTAYICTKGGVAYNPAEHTSEWPASRILHNLNGGAWTYGEEVVSPLPRKFTILAHGTIKYVVDLDAETLTSERGSLYGGIVAYNEEFVRRAIDSGAWVIVDSGYKTPAQREAEEAAAKEARKDAVIEAAKQLTAALTAYNEAAAKLAEATAKL